MRIVEKFSPQPGVYCVSFLFPGRAFISKALESHTEAQELLLCGTLPLATGQSATFSFELGSSFYPGLSPMLCEPIEPSDRSASSGHQEELQPRASQQQKRWIRPRKSKGETTCQPAK